MWGTNVFESVVLRGLSNPMGPFRKEMERESEHKAIINNLKFMNFKQNVYLLFATINIELFSSLSSFSCFYCSLLFCCYPSSDVSNKRKKKENKKAESNRKTKLRKQKMIFH